MTTPGPSTAASTPSLGRYADSVDIIVNICMLNMFQYDNMTELRNSSTPLLPPGAPRPRPRCGGARSRRGEMTTRRPRPPGSPPPSTGTPRPRSGPRWRSSPTSSGSPRWADTEYHHLHSTAWLQKTVIYSGAGISVAAGLGQAARSSGDPDGDPQVEHYLPASLRAVPWLPAAGPRWQSSGSEARGGRGHAQPRGPGQPPQQRPRDNLGPAEP